MTKTENLICWDYQVTYPVPISVGTDGTVEWEERSEYCSINLPDSIEDPAAFLKQCSYDDQIDIVDFAHFERVGD